MGGGGEREREGVCRSVCVCMSVYVRTMDFGFGFMCVCVLRTCISYIQPASAVVTRVWPLAHFSKMVNQNIKQDTFKYTNGQSNSYYRYYVSDTCQTVTHVIGPDLSLRREGELREMGENLVDGLMLSL